MQVIYLYLLDGAKPVLWAIIDEEVTYQVGQVLTTEESRPGKRPVRPDAKTPASY